MEYPLAASTDQKCTARIEGAGRVRVVCLMRAAMLVAFAGVPIASKAQITTFTKSGDYYLPGCQLLIGGIDNNGDAVQMFRAGECLGIITALQVWYKGVGVTCTPSTATVGQVIRVIVKVHE